MNSKTYKCPGCGMKIAAVEYDAYHGITCPSCRVGFIPVKRSARVELPSNNAANNVLLLLLLLLLLSGAWFFFGWIGPVIVLLGAIAAGVWRIAAAQNYRTK